MSPSRPIESPHELPSAVVLEAPCGILLVDRHGSVRLANREAARMFGRSVEEMERCRVEDLVPEPDRQRHAALRGAFEGAGASRAMGHGRDLVGVRADGTPFPVEIGLAPVALGGESYVVAFLSDIAARRRQEDALRESESRYRALVEGSIQGILIHQRGRVLLANPSLARMLGYDDHELLVGRSLFDFLPDEEKERVRGLMEARVRGEPVPPVYRLQARHRDQRLIWLEAVVSVIDWSGSPALLVTLQDVTEQRRLELQLREEQKSEALSQIARGVAHDFNNLLSVIASYSSAMREDMESGDPRHEDVEAIQLACRRAEQLSRQLMHLGRRNEGGTRLLSLNDLLQGLEGLLRPALGRSIQLTIHLAPVLSLVRADPSALEQVVMNLAVNARDAMPGGGTLTLTTQEVQLDVAEVERHLGARVGRFVRLEVRDDGTGITPEVRERIFEPFFTTKPAGQGTGLGLSIVDRVVRESGGFVTLESAPGKGACFRVHLPIAA